MIKTIYKIDLDGSEVDYEVKKYKNLKYLKLKMDRERLIVTVPYSYTYKDIESFILSKKEWVTNQVARQKTLNYQGLLYGGIHYEYQVKYCDKDNVIVENNKINIYIKEKYGIDDIKSILQNWYMTEAEKAIIMTTNNYAKLMKVCFNRVVIKNQKTRWGSCSSKKNLNFNWKLIMAPNYVLEYIVVHELCHLIHMNHSAQFWREVTKYYPNYRKAEYWLKENQHFMYINYKELS